MGHIKGVPIGTHFSSDIVFRALLTFEKFDLCDKREPMKLLYLTFALISGNVFASTYINIAHTNISDGLFESELYEVPSWNLNYGEIGPVYLNLISFENRYKSVTNEHIITIPDDHRLIFVDSFKRRRYPNYLNGSSSNGYKSDEYYTILHSISYGDGGHYFDVAYITADPIIGPATLKIAGLAQVYTSSYGEDLYKAGNTTNFYYSTWILEKTEQSIAQETLELLQAIASQTNSGQTTTITNTIVNTITNAVGYTLSEVADMRLGSQMVSVSNSQALLRFGLDMSDDLTATWQTNAYEIDVEIPATNDVQFFRLRMD